MNRLYADHANLAKLLEFISAQSSIARKGGSPDLAALVEAVEYLGDYPIHFHHSLEDALCDRLVNARPAASQYVDGIRREHQEIGARFTRFRQLIADARNMRTVTQADFSSAVDAFVAAERAHMERENKELFPAATSVLKQHDWNLLRERMSYSEDPLFSQRSAGRFVHLRRLMMEEGGR